MRTEVKIRNERESSIDFADIITVEKGTHFTSITRFHRLGDKNGLDMILLTPEETKEMAKALNSIIRQIKKEEV